MKITQGSFRPVAAGLALSLCGGALFNALRVPLPWMLGPLFFVGFAGINSVRVSDVRGGLRAGQLIIGCGLGLYFTPEVSWQLFEFGGYIVAAAFFCILIAPLIDESIPAMILATAPGGLAEMCITAKVLRLGVPLVTSFQVTRLIIVITCSLPMWNSFKWCQNRLAGRKNRPG